jgi:hypothetical protein
MVALFRRIGPAGVLVLAALALVFPSGAQAAGCSTQPSAQTFLPWLDVAWYVPAPDGGLEGGGSGWALSGGAAVVDGNQPYLAGEHALALPGGASATTAPMCIGVEHPTIRLFARNAGAPTSALAVSVVFPTPLGTWQELPIGVVAGGSRWAPTAIMPVVANLLADRAAFRFTAFRDGGEWTIDDVYVDPYNKR